MDPIFSVPEGYTLLLSPDVGNGVPERSTWALMLPGFSGLGKLGWRKALTQQRA
ncbi:MAG TPA: hypothetical protein VMI72_06555 [Roseiarcus sp.]|nr:hypothetical protein [Roseiarcus sp.]